MKETLGEIPERMKRVQIIEAITDEWGDLESINEVKDLKAWGPVKEKSGKRYKAAIMAAVIPYKGTREDRKECRKIATKGTAGKAAGRPLWREVGCGVYAVQPQQLHKFREAVEGPEEAAKKEVIDLDPIGYIKRNLAAKQRAIRARAKAINRAETLLIKTDIREEAKRFEEAERQQEEREQQQKQQRQKNEEAERQQEKWEQQQKRQQKQRRQP